MKVGMIFPGYTSQFVGMGKELYDQSRLMQEYFEEASNCLNVNFVKLCFASSDAELSKLYNASTSLFLVSSSITALLKEAGVKPDLVAGYGIGIYAALFAAHGINVPDGLYLLAKFSQLYDEFCGARQLRIVQVTGLSAAKAQAICDEITEGDQTVSIASYKSALEHIVSGVDGAVTLFELAAREQKAKIYKLPIAYGMHSPIIKEISTIFKMYLEKVDCNNLTVPLISSIDGRPILNGSQVKDLIVRSSYSPIKWVQVMKRFAPCDIILEVGPRTVLADIAAALYPEKTVLSICKPDDIEQVKELVISSASDQEGIIEQAASQ